MRENKTQDLARLAEITRLCQEPDPLELATGHAAASPGPWAEWTLERQVWYLRKSQGLTQVELAAKAGITQARLSALERGASFKWSTLKALFRALGYGVLILPAPLGVGGEGRPFAKPLKAMALKKPAGWS